MGHGSSKPSVLRTIAVSTEDVVTALEDRIRRDGDAVLRVTPPFHGRMRARLHVTTPGEYDDSPQPVHIDPRALVDPIPPYPEPTETEDAIRADPDLEYSPSLHRERHVAAVERWRTAVRERIVDEVEIEPCTGRFRVAVVVLG